MFARLLSFKGACKHLDCFDLFRINLHISLGSFCVYTALLENGPKQTPLKRFTYALLIAASWNNKMSCGLTWCSEEARCCIRAGEDISHLLDTKMVKFIKS